jgi:transcriptional regulator with GAF, ATPase, and Fis domain
MLAIHASAESVDLRAAMSGPARPSMPTAADRAAPDNSEDTGLHNIQRTHILRVLDATQWVIEGNSGAAAKLGMKPGTLRHRMKKLGISRNVSPVSQRAHASE